MCTPAYIFSPSCLIPDSGRLFNTDMPNSSAVVGKSQQVGNEYLALLKELPFFEPECEPKLKSCFKEEKKPSRNSVRFDENPVSEVFKLSPAQSPSPTASPPCSPFPHRHIITRRFGNLGPPQRVPVQRSQDDSDL
ncbi:MAG: hypothetical protein K940chlam8_00685 [Chlamydiae bacterium]|nr:hypothetical protein [Chlamydiota bacterium]